MEAFSYEDQLPAPGNRLLQKTVGDTPCPRVWITDPVAPHLGSNPMWLTAWGYHMHRMMRESRYDHSSNSGHASKFCLRLILPVNCCILSPEIPFRKSRLFPGS